MLTTFLGLWRGIGATKKDTWIISSRVVRKVFGIMCFFVCSESYCDVVFLLLLYYGLYSGYDVYCHYVCVYHYCFFCLLSLSLSLLWLWLLLLLLLPGCMVHGYLYLDFTRIGGPTCVTSLAQPQFLRVFFRDSWGFANSWPFLEGCKHDVFGLKMKG